MENEAQSVLKVLREIKQRLHVTKRSGKKMRKSIGPEKTVYCPGRE
jgi:hypothetical protein